MKTRFISAVALLLIFVPVLLLGDISFAIFMSIASVLCLYELLKIKKTEKSYPVIIEIVSFISLLFLTLNNYNSLSITFDLDYRVIVFMCLSFLSSLVFINDVKKFNVNDAFFLLAAIVFLGLAFNLLILFRNYKLEYVIYVFLVACVTDIFAYFTGKNIGKHKLIEKISPNKTVEGMLGGTLMGTFVGSIFFHLFLNPSLNIGIAIFVTMCLSLFGQLGDLVFSFIKREFNKKDFSNVIPGHGGILDRLDSVIFITLAFLLFLVII